MPELISTNPRSARDAGFVNAWPHKSCISPCSDDFAAPPINRVPVEVLAEIFAYCHQNDLADRCTPPHFPITPLILGQVCNRWKDITLAFPILWSSIVVHYPRRRHVPMVKLWLARSGSCPLSLTISHHPNPSPQQHEVTDEILSWFVQHVSRWREIDFKLYEIVQRPLLTIPEGATKSLECVTLDLESCDQESADRIWRTIHTSPSLSRVDWWRSYTKMPDHVPWLQLTHITLRSMITVDVLLDVLRSCQEIRILEASSLFASPMPALRVPLLVSALHTMKIHVRADSGRLLDQLTLPSLRSLDIQHLGPLVPRNPRSLHDLLVRSDCDLEELHLDDSVIAEEDLLVYLNSPRLVPLVTLGIIGYLTDTTVTALTRQFVDGREGCLLPNLRNISLGICRTSDGAVSAMVASRFAQDRLLRAVKVCLEGISSTCDFASLRQMREAGLFVDVYSLTSGSAA